MKNEYLKAYADTENTRRRLQQEAEQTRKYRIQSFALDILPVLDNLERAVEAPAGEEYKSGVDMTIRQFHEALIALGLEEIPADNQPFDPEVHHAVMREDADGIEPETVTAVFQKGYKYGDRVLRPAMVKVAN